MPYAPPMSTTGAARADSLRNKQRIVEAAATALVENPEVSVGEIAERAGLTRATIYRHYPDRDELVRAVAAHSASQMVPALLAEMRELDWPDALALLAQRAVALSTQHRELILRVTPQLEESARLAVAGEPIQAEITARRTSGEITNELPDEWLALCIRTLCLAAISRLTDPEVTPEEATAHLAQSLQDLAS